MYKLGIGMFVASHPLLIGWFLHKLWQEGATDVAVFVLFVALCVGGIVLAFTSGKI